MVVRSNPVQLELTAEQHDLVDEAFCRIEEVREVSTDLILRFGRRAMYNSGGMQTQVDFLKEDEVRRRWEHALFNKTTELLDLFKTQPPSQLVFYVRELSDLVRRSDDV